MNNERMKFLTYKKIDVANLLSLLSHTKVNMLVIGRHNSWVINARAIHKNQFVGTRGAVGLTNKAGNMSMWSRLKNLTLKYAAPGSAINVFYLYLASNGSSYIAQCYKSVQSDV